MDFRNVYLLLIFIVNIKSLLNDICFSNNGLTLCIAFSPTLGSNLWNIKKIQEEFF